MTSKSARSCDQHDSKTAWSDQNSRHPIQTTDDTVVKRETKYSTAVSEDETGLLDSGFRSASYHSQTSLTSRLSSMSLGAYNPQDSDNVYNMDHPKRGYLVVINNRTFEPHLNLPERSGTDMDASMVYSTFKSMGFEVSIHNNLTNLEMLRLFIKYSEMNHEACDCFAATILSHGDEGYVYGTNAILDIKKLVEPLKSCKSLVGKPKLFFIQACQGFKFDEGNDVTDAEVYVEEKKVVRLPKEADFLYAYSTSPGFYAFRNSTRGSYFMQAIAKVFKEWGGEFEVTRLLTRVSRTVAIEFESRARDAAFSGKKQMPCFLSTLTKDLYFPTKK